MQSSTKRNLRLTALIAALVAAGSMLPVAQRWRAGPPDTRVAAVPAPPAPAANPNAEPAPPPAPPGTEVVPPEESETDHGPAAATPSGPTLSAGRVAGLHLTPDPMHLSASAALVVDQGSGEVLVRKNDQAVLPMASLTKLMTALVVFEAGQPMDEVLTITQDDVDTERHSRSRLRPGTQLTREEAFHLALMSSENRAAHALARSYPGGLDKAIAAMNAKARQLGMKNTTYFDPTGLTNRNQSTARDLAVLVGAAAKVPMIREFSTTPAHLAALGGRTLQYINSNRLVRNQRSGWDIELQKTGYIVEAGRCQTMLTRVAGHDLIMVLLDSESNSSRVADLERMRRFVVAQNKWEDDLVATRAQPAARKVRVAAAAAAPEHARAAPAGKKAGHAGARAGTATRHKPAAHSAVAESQPTARKEAGRVKQTFAAARSSSKS